MVWKLRNHLLQTKVDTLMQAPDMQGESVQDEIGIVGLDELDHAETQTGEGIAGTSSGKSRGWPQIVARLMDMYRRSPFWRRNSTIVASNGGIEQKIFLVSRHRHPKSAYDNTLKEPLLCTNGIESPTPDESIEGNNAHRKQQIVTKDQSHDTSEGTTFLRASLNGMNVLAGVGILSTPYAVSEGGWLGLGFLLLFAVICCYTGILLRRCMDVRAGRACSYPDIGEMAFGWNGRAMVSILLYCELYAVAVEFLILEGDNLAQLFPRMAIEFAGMSFKARQAFVLLSGVIILPTMWLRNPSLLAYVSAGGVAAAIVVTLAVGWVGAFEGVGFHHRGQLLNLSGLPTAVGLYTFCYCGHAVFPYIYSSMRDPTQFSNVLIVCFAVSTVIYGSVAVMGYMMFGKGLASQVTLNLPRDTEASKVAIYTTLINPLAKFALTLTPLARALEALLPVSNTTLVICGLCIRTLLVVSTIAVAISVPLFGYLMALIGSLLSSSVSLILPCICYMKIFGSSIPRYEMFLILAILSLAIVTGTLGTYSSLQSIALNI